MWRSCWRMREGEMSNSFVESKVRTNKLKCSGCGRKLRIGEEVIFELYHGRMLNVYCDICKGDYKDEVEFSGHNFSNED